MDNTNNNTDLIKDFYNVKAGTYKAYFNGCDLCYLFSISKSILKYILNKNDSNLIFVRVKDLKHEIIKISDQYYCDYNIELINKIKCKSCSKIKCKCSKKYKYVEIYIKINNEEPLSIYKEDIISELKSFNSYIISKFFSISNIYFYIITSNGHRYYINKEVINILRKYFKHEDGKIICMYNNKKEIAKLTLITEELKSWIGIFQSLKLEIGNKKFTFYINRFKERNDNKKNTHKLSIFLICYNSIYRYNVILGYEPNTDIYYRLYYDEREFLLKHINQEIAKKFNDGENINIYTYLSYNNKYYGLKVNERKTNDNNLLKLDNVFETILDISLLKPVNEWDNEEINAKKKYYEKEYKDNIENNPTKDNNEK